MWFIVSIIVFLIFLSIHNATEKEQKEIVNRNRIKREMYLQEKEQYDAELREFNNLKQIESNPEKDRNYRIQKLTELINNTTCAEVYYKGKKGSSEKLFIDYLEQIFGDRILSNLIMETFSNSKPYQADIIFYYREFNIWIDIEVDEAYDFIEKQPIHYINDYNLSVDSNRNDYFLNHGWFVLRFSETQVIPTPLECAKYLNDFLFEYFEIDEFAANFDETEELQSMECWTYDEVKKMAIKNSRGY